MKKFIFLIALTLAQPVFADEVSDAITQYFKARAKNPDAMVVKCSPGIDMHFSMVKCVIKGTNSFGGTVTEEYTVMVNEGEITVMEFLAE